MMVLASISFMEIFIASSDEAPLNFIKFSRIRSNATTVSLSEYPITARTAATTERSNGKANKEKKPIVTITS